VLEVRDSLLKTENRSLAESQIRGVKKKLGTLNAERVFKMPETVILGGDPEGLDAFGRSGG